MTVLGQIVSRLATVVPTLIGVVVVTFLLSRVLPGDTAAYFSGPMASAQSIADIRARLGLDQPLYEQFLRYIGDLSRGDLGNSLSTGQPVLAEIRSRLPASAELALLGLLFAVLIAVPLGSVAAIRQGSIVDHVCRVIATTGISLPVFFTGLLSIYLFYYLLNWAPAPLGRLGLFHSPPATITGFHLIDSLLRGELGTFGAALSQICLPALTLGLFAVAPIARMTRASMLAVLSADFVRTARANGLSARTVIAVYAFRNAMLPVITTLGMVFSFLLGGSVLVEKVFAWPGIGSYAIEALLSSDYAPVQGFVLTMALLYTALNFMIDLAYGLIDPRVKVGR